MLSSIGLIICSISVINCYNYDLDVETIEKNEKLCLNPPPLCSCFTIHTLYSLSHVYSCFHDESREKIVLKFYIDNDDSISMDKVDVSLFEIIPNLTNYIKSSAIYFRNIMLPENVSLYDLTSKISTNIKHLNIGYLEPNGVLSSNKYNKHLFNGLSQLECLTIHRIHHYIILNIDIFENLVNLKKLILSDPHTMRSHTLKVSFATLHQLQVLKIENNKVKIEVGAFKNLINLVELELVCSEESFVFSEMLKNLTNLEILKISGPFMIVWPESMFKNNPKLKSIKLRFIAKSKTSSYIINQINQNGGAFNFSSIEDLSEDVFKTLSNLEELILTENMLKSLPKDVFVDLIRLELLDLRYNNLIKLHDELFDTTLNMKTLMLTSNKLTNISRNVFAKLRKLEKLLLNHNKLKTIDDSFKRLVNLREINLSFNQLSHNHTNNLFDRLRKMEKLYLNNNQLEDFFIYNNTDFEDLQIIDLSHNKISTLKYSVWTIDQNHTKLKINLNHNRIKHFKMDDLLQPLMLNQGAADLLLIVNNNPVNCDCNAIDLVRFVKKQIQPLHVYSVIDFITNDFTCQEPKQLYNRFVSSVNTSELLCNIETDCPEGCRCDQRSVDDTLIINCSFTNFQQFPPFPNYTNLNLTKTELHVANNKIHSTQLTNIPDNLILFDLRNNSLEFLDENVIKTFESIDKLFLSRNPWKCNCNAVKFIKFYQIFRSQIVDADDIICSDGRAFKELNTNNLCVQWIEILVVFLLVLSLFAILTAFCVVN